MTPPRLSYTPICRAVALVSSIALGFGAPSVLAQADTVASQVQAYAIPAGPLGQVLSRFAAEAGILLTGDAALTDGLQSPGLEGSYSVAQGLQALLADTGLDYVRNNSGGYVLRRAQRGSLPPVKVSSSAISDGSAEAGYVSTTVSQVGPWQGRSLQDTPYSVSVVSESLIGNLQATTNPDKVFLINPVTQLANPQGYRGFNGVTMRGFRVNNAARNGIDRAGVFSSEGLILEEVDRIEILTGSSGFLYGADNVGGTINYVTKHPTEKRLTNISFGTTSGQNAYLHGDFGGQFDAKGSFGYRINVVTQGGDTHVDHQSIDRDSISAAFDWQVTDKLILDINLSWRDYLLEGQQTQWIAGTNRSKADDIDSSKLWGQRWTLTSAESQRSEIGLHWDIRDNLSFRSRYSTLETEKEEKYSIAFIQNDNTYNAGFQAVAPLDYKDEQGYAYLDVSFETGLISHKLTTGFQYGNFSIEQLSNPFPYITENGFSLDSPTYVPEPDWGPYGSEPKSTWRDAAQRTITIGDDISFNERWSALIGISDVEVESFDYKESKLTPTLSLLYKPQPWLTTYISYIEALEQGGTADDLYQSFSVINSGESLEPLTSEQIEIGAKTTLGDMLITAALFEIDKSLEYYNIINSSEAELVQDGRQIHRGLEVTATGKLTNNLTIVGGFTLLDAQVKNNEQSPDIEGKTPINVAEEMYSIYAEYNFPSVPRLALNGGISYVGNFYGNNINTDKIDGYTLMDVGARYQTELANTPLILRVNVNNLTDERYWVSGTVLGDARTVSFSANVQF